MRMGVSVVCMLKIHLVYLVSLEGNVRESWYSSSYDDGFHWIDMHVIADIPRFSPTCSKSIDIHSAGVHFDFPFSLFIRPR